MAEEKPKSALQKGAQALGKKYGWSLPELVPAIGFLWPGNIILVLKTLKGNLTGPEGILMLSIALFCYVITLVTGAIEIWFDLGIFTTLVTWAIWGFFAFWINMRGSGAGQS